MSGPRVAHFDTETSFRKAVDTVIAAAGREILVFDPDLSRLRLDEPARIEALRAFLTRQHGHRIRVALHETHHFEQHMPRFQATLQLFQHAIEIRQTPDELRHLAECFLVTANGSAAVRFHVDNPRGKLIFDDATEARPWLDRFDDLWERSSQCPAGRPLGL